MQCPYCKEEVMDGALKCKHCGSAIGSVSAQPCPTGQADFGEMFTAGLNLWKGNLGDLAVLTLVFMLVAWIPIANVGFIAGYTRSLLKVTRGDGKARAGDIFNSWDCFGNLLVYFLISMIAIIMLHFIPIIGSLASIAIGFLMVPGALAIIENKRSTLDAYKWSIETIQINFVNWLLVYLVGNVLIFAGCIVLVIGMIVTLPLGQLIILQQYERVKPV